MSNQVAPVIHISQKAWEPESRTSRRRSIIREFALTTSTHGLPGIARSQSKHNRIFWTISFLIFLGVMIAFVTQSIKNYFTYPTQTTLSYVFERSQTFPAVTFCNYAPARYDRVIGPLLNYTNSLNITNTNDTTIFTAVQAAALREFFRLQLNGNISVLDYFFSINTLLIGCSYNDRSCTASDFISFLSSSYGLCYTFNAKTKNQSDADIRQTNDNAGSGKLVLRLYTHRHLYIPYLADDVLAGMVAMIHDNTQLPQIDVAGIGLVPGRRHKLGYKKKANYLLSSPYTDCTDKVPIAMQAMFNRFEGADYKYSQSICFTLCTQAYIYQECGCVSPDQWSARSVVAKTIIEAPLCHDSDSCYSAAAIKLSNTTSIWNQFCSHCTEECAKVDFIVTPSAVAAPSLLYTYAAKSFVESLSVPLSSTWATDWLTDVQSNYVALEVVCESIQVENYTQEASVSATDVLSNVGGHSGLWIGISFLSIMELVEMLYRLLRYEYHLIRGRM